MSVSADALLFGLRLLDEEILTSGELAGHLRAIACGEAPDDLVALEEKVLAAHPRVAGQAALLALGPDYLPVHCPGCGGRFRVRSERIHPDAYCPLCGEAIIKGRSAFLLGHRWADRPRAAESVAAFELAPPGRRFAHFELLELLGKGGAGKVYRARNVRSARVIALKLLDFQPLEPAARSFQRLRREAAVATSITHPNIVRVFDMGVAEGIPYIEMELVPGVSLHETVRRRGPLRAGEACRLCAETLDALQEVHGRKIVHGDVKPGNILIHEDGAARLTDFGVSRLLEETTSLTTTGRLMGSPHFMAPEQWRGEALSPATDLYAMGLVLYYALLGRLPYGDRTHLALMYQHLYEPLLDPREPSPLIPDPVADVIRRATEKAPRDRFATAREFAAALQRYAP